MTDHTPARLRELAERHDHVNGIGHPHGPVVQPSQLSLETATYLRAAADKQEADAKAIAEMRGMLKRAMEQLLIEDIAQQGLGFESPDARTLAAEIAALLGDDDAPAS